MKKVDYRMLDNMEDLEFQPFPQVCNEFRICIVEAAFDQINLREETSREVGGVLVGEVRRDAGGPFVKIDTIIEALHAEERGAELTFTHATWEHINREMDTVHVDKRIVGWYHTHPGFGIFLSEQDQFIHRSFFDLPFQIALVYDPLSREHGVFTWRDGNLWRSRRYWVGSYEHLWDGHREPDKKSMHSQAPAPPPSVQAESYPTARQPEKKPLSWAGSELLIACALALLVGLLLGQQSGLRASSLDAREQAAKEVAASLNTDLLSILRGSLSDESLGKNLDEWYRRLRQKAEEINAAAVSDPTTQSALQQLSEAVEMLGNAREERRLAHAMLGRLEETVRQAPRNLETLENSVSVQRVALGRLYAEIAQDALRAGDRSRAQRLLLVALEQDPSKRAVYETQLRALEQPGWSWLPWKKNP